MFSAARLVLLAVLASVAVAAPTNGPPPQNSCGSNQQAYCCNDANVDSGHNGIGSLLGLGGLTDVLDLLNNKCSNFIPIPIIGSTDICKQTAVCCQNSPSSGGLINIDLSCTRLL